MTKLFQPINLPIFISVVKSEYEAFEICSTHNFF